MHEFTFSGANSGLERVLFFQKCNKTWLIFNQNHFVNSYD